MAKFIIGIKAKAIEAMEGKWGRFVGMNILYIVISLLIVLITLIPLFGSLGNLVNVIENGNYTEKAITDVVSGFAGTSALSSLLSIAAMLIEVPLAYALIENIMKAKRDNETTATYFLGRIFPNFARAWKVTLWTLVKMIVPYLLFVVGMIVVVLVASLLSGLGDVGAFLAIVVAMAGYVALIIWFISKVLNLILGDYIAIDNPEITAKEAVEKSIELMNGYRWKAVCLSISFLGWAILCCFTLGIGNLFLTPYMSVASVVFYEEVLKAHEQTVGTAPAAEPVAEPVVEEQPTQE